MGTSGSPNPTVRYFLRKTKGFPILVSLKLMYIEMFKMYILPLSYSFILEKLVNGYDDNQCDQCKSDDNGYYDYHNRVYTLYNDITYRLSQRNT